MAEDKQQTPPEQTPPETPVATPATVFGDDTYLYSKKFPGGKLFLAGEEIPDSKLGFVDNPEKI